jgi:hypothetical protein
LRKGTTPDGLFSGVLGAAVFAVFYFLLDIGLVLSIGLAIVAFVGGLFLFQRRRAELIEKENDLRDSLDAGDKKHSEIRDPGIQASLARVEGMLGTLKDAFEAQLAKLLSNDVMDLDSALQTLKQAIEMEGLGKE